MVTPAVMRRVALSMPEAEERSHFEQPDFRVRGKIFAGLSRDGKRANVKLTPELQAVILGAKPAAFFPAQGAWGRGGWTYIELAEVELGELKDLVAEAWRLVAPKTLVAAVARGEKPARAKARRRAK